MTEMTANYRGVELMSTYVTANPTTGQTEKQFDELSDGAVTQILGRSAGAFSTWRATPVAERAQILIRAADAYDARQDELGKLISTEMGKPMKEACLLYTSPSPRDS